MATVSLEQQRQLGRELGQIQRAAEILDQSEKSADTGRIKSAGAVAFILLGSFALLKDVFDFVFVGMLSYKSGVTSVAEVGDLIGNLGVISAIPHPVTVIAGRIAAAIGYASIPLSWAGGLLDAKAQAEAIIVPFELTTMFMIAVIATLLLSGIGVRSLYIFRSPVFIIASFLSYFIEITAWLNILPWMTIYVIVLYFVVRRERKKQWQKHQTV